MEVISVQFFFKKKRKMVLNPKELAWLGRIMIKHTYNPYQQCIFSGIFYQIHSLKHFVKHQWYLFKVNACYIFLKESFKIQECRVIHKELTRRDNLMIFFKKHEINRPCSSNGILTSNVYSF